jgi:hypothetical protein
MEYPDKQFLSSVMSSPLKEKLQMLGRVASHGCWIPTSKLAFARQNWQDHWQGYCFVQTPAVESYHMTFLQ